MSEGTGGITPQTDEVGATVALQLRLGGEGGIVALTEPLGATLMPTGPDGAGSTVQLDGLSSEAVAALASVPIDGIVFTDVEGSEDTPFYAEADDRISPESLTIMGTQQERRLPNASLPPISAAALQALFRKK